MFAFLFDTTELKQSLRLSFDRQFRRWAGVAFMALAMMSIQYDEVIAPEVNRLSDNWSTVATDFSKRLSSFTL
jgi:membrane protease subunit (stomatin/prohibitin family)